MGIIEVMKGDHKNKIETERMEQLILPQDHGWIYILFPGEIYMGVQNQSNEKKVAFDMDGAKT